MNILPDNKVLTVILILIALMYPINYFLMEYYPPEGHKFVSLSIDNSDMLAGMKSYIWNYQSPWLDVSDDYNVFAVPTIPYIYVLLGFVAHSLNIDIMLFFVITKFIFAFFFLLVCYHFIIFISPVNTKKYSLIFFYLYMGVSGVIYTIVGLKYEFTKAFFPEVWEGSGLSIYSIIERSYNAFPLALGLLALLLFLKIKNDLKIKNILVIGLLQGIVMFFYPVFAITIILIQIIYILLYFSKEKLKIIITELLFMFVLFLPYLYIKFSKPYFFNTYYFNPPGDGTVFLPSILMAVLPLFLIFILKFGNKKLLLSYIITSIILSITQLIKFIIESPRNEISSLMINNQIANILYQYQILFYLPLLIVIAFHIIYLLLQRYKIDKNILFLALWFLIILLLSIPPQKFVVYHGSRLFFFLGLPLSIISGYALSLFSKNSKKIILILFSIMFVFGLFAINFNTQMTYRVYSKHPTFVTNDEYDALMFIKNMSNPNAKVLSNYLIGIYIPYTTEKRSLIGSGNNYVFNYTEKVEDYKIFFSNNTTSEQRCKIVFKYNLTYIFSENNMSEDSFKLNNPKIGIIHAKCLKLIFNKGNVQVYETVGVL